MKKLFFILLAVFVSAPAHAITPQSFFEEAKAGFPSVVPNYLMPDYLRWMNLNADYQIGAEWGKKPVTAADLESDAQFARMAKATARVRSGGTGFYLGEFNGQYVVATNHHVCPSADACSGTNVVEFPLLGIRAGVLKFYGTWPEIDLALFAIRSPSPEAIEALNAVASPFDFAAQLKRGQKLTTIGFGVANNPRRQLVANRDSDCLVYSGDSEYRLMADPDDFNPGPYKAWSFANGCDVSHGDSGSAMMDRDTGRVIGIIWTGRIPKNPKVRSAEFMHNLLREPTEDVWKELSYGVPAVHMRPYLQQQVEQGVFEPAVEATLRAILQ